MQHSGLATGLKRSRVPELRAVVERLHEFVDIVDGGRLAQQSNALLVEGLRLLLDVLLLGKEIEVALGRNAFARGLVLKRGAELRARQN